mmetsp:Transcript_14211/g.40431  ORF Transcript_14211/g.40431 Transcript_14211/m.40431 type:complete len:265 (+) Transcript_14211:262-1056(+)
MPPEQLLRWTKTSPSQYVMKPKPFSSLNSFTLPSQPVAAAGFGRPLPPLPLPLPLSPPRSAWMARMSAGKGASAGPRGRSPAAAASGGKAARTSRERSWCLRGRTRMRRSWTTSSLSQTKRLPPSSDSRTRTAVAWLSKFTTARPLGRPSMPRTMSMSSPDSVQPGLTLSQSHCLTCGAMVKKGRPSRQRDRSPSCAPTNAARSASMSTGRSVASALMSSWVALSTIHESSRPQCSAPIISTPSASQICLSVEARTPRTPEEAT